MKCADIMSKNLEFLTEHDSVEKAAALMAEAGIGFLPICDARKRVLGVVTDRDLTTRVLAKKIAADTTSATLVMTSPALTCLETTDVRDAEELMAQERKSRLVITDEDGRLTGILSLADPVAQNLPPPSDDIEVRPTVFTGGHRPTDTKEFPTG
jgi:CBS domain-containing protein